MNALRFDILPTATVQALTKLAKEPALAGFCLVGGTAIALQAGHRRSLDIDLAFFGPRLDKNGLHQAMRRLGATLITPQTMISTAKINGIDLLAYAQDYVLDGVKVQCFAHPQGALYEQGKQSIPEWIFALADLGSLFKMKSALMTQRTRSRDLFDLMCFCQQGKTLANIVAAAQEANDAPETPVIVEHKLLGLLPLDIDDEGLDPVDGDFSLADIYRYFENQVQTAEIAIAKEMLANKP